MCLTGPPEPWLCLLGLDQRLPTPSQSREALTPLVCVVPGKEREQNLCHSHQPQPWQAGPPVGSPPAPSAVLRRCWCLPALAPCSPAEILQQPVLGFVPGQPCCFQHGGVCWGEGSAPCPAANTQLQVSTGEKLLQHIQGTSSPPAKHKLCAKPGSDRHMSFTKPFCPLPFFLSFHVLYLSLERFKTSFDRQDVVAPASVERVPGSPDCCPSPVPCSGMAQFYLRLSEGISTLPRSPGSCSPPEPPGSWKDKQEQTPPTSSMETAALRSSAQECAHKRSISLSHDSQTTRQPHAACDFPTAPAQIPAPLCHTLFPRITSQWQWVKGSSKH